MSRQLRSIVRDPPEDIAGDAPAFPQEEARGDSRVAGLAALVRSVYVLTYREVTGRGDYGVRGMETWDGGQDKMGRNHSPVWPKIASKIIEVGADPVEFVRALFFNKPWRSPPTPNMLLSESALAAWRERLAGGVGLRYRLCKEIEGSLLAINGVVAAYVRGPGWPEDRALRYALGSTVGETASVLLRYVLAVQHGFGELAQHLHERALTEYIFRHQEYDAVLGQNIPQALRHEASDLRRRLLAVAG